MLSKRASRVAVGLVTLLCVAASYWQFEFPFLFGSQQTDLLAYYTAASLIHDHRGDEIYDGADNGVDPQLRMADKGSIFGSEALSRGIQETSLYVYPPLLAYLISPLAGFPISDVLSLWKILNWVELLVASVVLTRLLGLRLLGFGGLCVFLLLFAYRPTLECFFYGQITIMMLLLEVGGMLLYSRGHKTSGALLFAVATAIKITPAIVIVPLVAWRDWKALRAFALGCLAIAGTLWIPDGGRLVVDFVAHVMPAMASGIIAKDNKALSSSLQFCWSTIRPGSSTRWLGIGAKIVSVATVLYAGWLSRSRSNDENGGNRIEILALLLLLSCCVAPVSWRHAYVASAPALAIFFKRMLEGKARVAEAIVVSCFTLSISSFGFSELARSTGNPILAMWANCAPVLGVAVVIMGLRRLREGVCEIGHRPYGTPGVLVDAAPSAGLMNAAPTARVGAGSAGDF